MTEKIYTKYLKNAVKEDSYKSLKNDRFENNLKNRLLLAGTGAATPLVLGKILGGSKTNVLTASLLSGILGYLTIPTINKSLEMIESGKDDKDVSQFFNQYQNIPMSNLEKNSSIPMLFKTVGKGLLTGTKEIGKGFMGPAPWKATRTVAGKSVRIPIGERALSAVVKGGVLYGGAKGLKSVYDKSRPYDYHTHLRNNILAGNINPQELTGRNMQIVMKRGMN